MSLTKKDLVLNIATDTELSKKDVESVLDRLAAIAQNELGSGNDLVIPGIGKLSTQVRAARQGRNPATGETIDIAEKTVVKFNAAKPLKDAAA